MKAWILRAMSYIINVIFSTVYIYTLFFIISETEMILTCILWLFIPQVYMTSPHEI